MPIKEALNRVGAIAGGLAACAGFVADVLQPLAPFARILFFAALACLLVCVIAAFKTRSPWTATGIIFTSFMALTMGGLALLQIKTERHIGFFAEAIPAVAGLQKKLPLPAPPLPPELPKTPPPPPPGAPPFPPR